MKIKLNGLQKMDVIIPKTNLTLNGIVTYNYQYFLQGMNKKNINNTWEFLSIDKQKLAQIYQVLLIAHKMQKKGYLKVMIINFKIKKN